VPIVLVDETVVHTAEQNEVVQVGDSSDCPCHDVVDLQPAGVATARVLTDATVAFVDETA
jgi:hypothetical protein